ncbi:hypothetical protein GCM10010400_01020 [Streptomyces aculeolatus]|uniref:hypothetical protein n=1 Tax=Streptomyces aculeolatus TaxID=270689 RepID=UPI001CED1859|nr:hypothetical protein [Streptomyces aculeolatus]
MHGESPDEALAEALRSGPFHLALRAAVRRRGLALHRIRHRLAEQGLRVSVTSLSYWQRGERVPARSESVQVVRALEGILGIVPGALVRLLEPVHGGTGGGTRAARRYQELIGPAAAVLRLLEQLDCPTEDRLHTVSQFEQVRVGRWRELWQREIQQFVRAHRGNVDRYVSLYEGDFGCDVTRVRIAPLDNCRLGRYPVSHYLLQVSFAPPALPVRCYRFTRRASGAPRRRVVQVPLNGYHSTHLAEQELGPGIVGLGWEWD